MTTSPLQLKVHAVNHCVVLSVMELTTVFDLLSALYAARELVSVARTRGRGLAQWMFRSEQV